MNSYKVFVFDRFLITTKEVTVDASSMGIAIKRALIKAGYKECKTKYGCVTIHALRIR